MRNETKTNLKYGGLLAVFTILPMAIIIGALVYFLKDVTVEGIGQAIGRAAAEIERGYEDGKQAP